MGTGKQATDATGALQASAQVNASRVADNGIVIDVPLLDYEHPVIDVVSLSSHGPNAAVPSGFLAFAQAAQAVINEIGAPPVLIVVFNASKPILVIIGITNGKGVC